MNLREGTRRLALLLGAVGMILCGVVSYVQLQSTMRQRAEHQRWTQLTSSPVLESARKDCLENSAPPEHGSSDKYQIPGKKPQESTVAHDTFPANVFDKHQPYCFVPEDDPNTTDYIAADLNSAGIKTVHFVNRENVSIETQDGQTFYPTPAPGVWSYLLVAILPVLGFFIPWGAIRAIGWVLSGFVKPSE